MAILPILEAPDARLRQISEPVERVDDELYVVLFVLRPVLRAQVRPVLLGTVRAVRAALA